MCFQQRGRVDVGWFLINLKNHVRPKRRKIWRGCEHNYPSIRWLFLSMTVLPTYLQRLSSVEHINEMESIRRRKDATPTSATTHWTLSSLELGLNISGFFTPALHMSGRKDPFTSNDQSASQWGRIMMRASFSNEGRDQRSANASTWPSKNSSRIFLLSLDTGQIPVG